MNICTRPTSEYSGMVIDKKEKTEKEIFKTYTCLAINNTQCETTNHTFQLQVECEYEKQTYIFLCYETLLQTIPSDTNTGIANTKKNNTFLSKYLS